MAIIEAAELVSSELATNAVLHAGTPFQVSVRLDGELRLAVTDGNTRPPRRREPDASRQGGRGLSIVEALSTQWGCDPLDGGKCVWCVLSAQEH